MPRVSMRDVLIEAGQKVLHERGYAATAVQDIAAVAGVPKGSFFNHFGTKEAFAALALERYVGAGVDGLVHLMDNDSLPILQRITMLIDAVSDRVKATGGREGCMVGNLSIEVAGASEPLRVQLSDAFSRWCAPLAGALERAQARGEIALTVESATMANFIQNGLQGALLRAKVDRTSAPIEQFKVILLDLLSRRQAEAKRTSAQRP
ncbi:MAG: TetR family transcriptional regulator C-terminal domain-containing protein [Rhodobacter sp.]|nr:TetR family transcriptional regulator C-terminal domain-containing protein [Rhodobacter sp.]